jgi:hypothetical protein
MMVSVTLRREIWLQATDSRPALAAELWETTADDPADPAGGSKVQLVLGLRPMPGPDDDEPREVPAHTIRACFHEVAKAWGLELLEIPRPTALDGDNVLVRALPAEETE